MSKYSSDSNSRDRTRSYSRYYNQRHRSSSSSSAEKSRHSKYRHSRKAESKRHKKSKRKHRSNSSSDRSTSRHKHSSRSHHKDESRSKKKHRRRSSSTSSDSDHSSISNKDNYSKSSKASHNEKSKNEQPNLVFNSECEKSVVKSEAVTSKDENINWLEKNVYDVMRRENEIEQINQEGFVFKVFKPSSELKEKCIEHLNISYDVPKFNDDIVNNLIVEDSAFLISNRHRLLNAKYKLLTKKERCDIWARYLFDSYKQSEQNNE
ncbi:peptidyl-prolyl cis-trans isomerase G-like [Sipha flava]|uniref:Peptidyl-prolyl cis-trans isomerase G-like n=1 Tax=Sipha flava TaxID=143950 RepID=A0A2S2QTX8_9HEMI|nr:peptidyl-prolyl cis-trans isomerase G-like [Sipha flava]